MIWLVSLGGGLTMMVFLHSILGHRARQWAMKQRLGRAVTAPEPAPREDLPWFARLATELGEEVRQMIPGTWISFLRRRLQAAGLRTTLEQFIGRWLLLLGAWYLVFSSLAAVVKLPLWFTLLVLALALLTPFGVLRMQEIERIRRIRREFPFLIDFITMAVEAGLSLDTALLRAGHKLKGPLGDELHRYVQNINHGLTRRDALTLFADSLGQPEIRDFVQVLIQSAASGLPLAEVLRRQAQQIREMHRLRAEELAQKIPIRMLFPLVLFVFPTIFLFVLGPALIWLFELGL